MSIHKLPPLSAQTASCLPVRHYQRILVANRGEIAQAICREAAGLYLEPVGVCSVAGDYPQQASRSVMLEDSSPVHAYLNPQAILQAARQSGADAIHPGYGFLSENHRFAQEVVDAGLTFVGPTPENIRVLGDKMQAKQLAASVGIPLIPGDLNCLGSVDDARDKIPAMGGYPVLLKAAAGGGGRGIRKVYGPEQLSQAYQEASTEAEMAFSSADLYLEKLLEAPRHIEVQVIADMYGNVVTALDRDCSIQRRNQKIIETAPAAIGSELREKLHDAAVKLAQSVGYRNLGTVEFLVDRHGQFYFIEMNTRIQVEYTVTEAVTGLNLIQLQLLLADGYSLAELGLSEGVRHNGQWAIETRVTSEDPGRNFEPVTGNYNSFSWPTGRNVRIDSGLNPQGGEITPYFDPMIAKMTVWGNSHRQAARHMEQALKEVRISGLPNNTGFLQQVIGCRAFLEQAATTELVDGLLDEQTPAAVTDPLTQKLRFIGEIRINGIDDPGASGQAPDRVALSLPAMLQDKCRGQRPAGLRDILKRRGKEAFLKSILEDRRLWLRDVTPRDAHQSLLATRVRTVDIEKYLHAASYVFPDMFFETHGGATMQTTGLFLKESPAERAERFRRAAPNLVFETHMRSSNGFAFQPQDPHLLNLLCTELVESEHVDIFRVFEPLNDPKKIEIGIQAIRQAGGIVAATPTYSPHLDTDHYLDYARRMVAMGADMLDLNDPSGALKIPAARSIFTAWREAFPDKVLRLHMHDCAGMAASVILSLAEEKVKGQYILNVADVSCDVMANGNSLAPLGSIVHTLQGTERDTGIDPDDIDLLNSYLMNLRPQYSRFETAGKTFSSTMAYRDLMPGGQNSNLQVQARATQQPFEQVRQCYIEAAAIMGNPPLVTPSSKACGDLALFLSDKKLDRHSFRKQLYDKQLSSLPQSFIAYCRGDMGEPPNGRYPEDREIILELFDRDGGGETDGKTIPSFDLAAARNTLNRQYGRSLSRFEVLWATMLPSAFESLESSLRLYGPVSDLPTHILYRPMEIGESVTLVIDGKEFAIALQSISEADANQGQRVFFSVNGSQQSVVIKNRKIAADAPKLRSKADGQRPGQVGAPMKGVVAAIDVEVGQDVAKGDLLFTTEAMKLQFVVQAPVSGVVTDILASGGDAVDERDLVVIIDSDGSA